MDLNFNTVFEETENLLLLMHIHVVLSAPDNSLDYLFVLS